MLDTSRVGWLIILNKESFKAEMSTHFLVINVQ